MLPREGHRLHRRRRLRRRLGPGERLRADGRRHQGRRRQGAADLRRPASRRPRVDESGQEHAGRGLRARRPGGRRPLQQDGPQRHRVRDDAGLRRGLRAAGRRRPRRGRARASSPPGRRARSSAPGCWTCWSARCTRTRSWSRSPATRRTPARAGGPSSRRIENAVPMPTIAASLFARFVSRQDDSPTMKAVAALRNQFGGHAVHAVRGAGGREARVNSPRGRHGHVGRCVS